MGVVKISQWRKEWVGRVACDSGVMKMVKKIVILSYFVHFFFFGRPSKSIRIMISTIISLLLFFFRGCEGGMEGGCK